MNCVLQIDDRDMQARAKSVELEEQFVQRQRMEVLFSRKGILFARPKHAHAGLPKKRNISD